MAKLDSQTLAAFGAACSNHGTTATRFHAGQETVRTCALDFGWLVCAFHDESYWLKLQMLLNCKLLQILFTAIRVRPYHRQREELKELAKSLTLILFESGKPTIIADFSSLATS
jgi:hypothetical protein